MEGPSGPWSIPISIGGPAAFSLYDFQRSLTPSARRLLASDTHPAPFLDQSALDHELRLGGVPDAGAAGAGPGPLGELEGGHGEVALVRGADQLRAARQRGVEEAGLGAIGDPQELRAVLGHAREREVAGGPVDVAAAQRPRPGVDHLRSGSVGAARDRPGRARLGGRRVADLRLLLLPAGGERERRQHGERERPASMTSVRRHGWPL